MPNIDIKVAGKVAYNMSPDVVIVCGNSDYIVTFDLDSEWENEETRTARFVYSKNGREFHEKREFTGDSVAVPVMTNVQQVFVGLYAGELHTTTPARVLCEKSILCGDSEEVLNGQEVEAAMGAVQAEVKKAEDAADRAEEALAGIVNPSASVEQTDTGATLTVTDANGTTTVQLLHGEKGDPGDTFEELTPDQLELLRGPKGAKGDKGDPGESVTGPQGPVGPVGPAGPKGDPFTYADFTEEQLAALTGPQGPKGADGTMTFEDLTQEQKDTLKGDPGPAGPKGDPFTYADFTEEQLAALTGPAGQKGDTGATGATGPMGPRGDAFTYEDFTQDQLAALTGPAGADGHTPQKGVDYWTDAEKSSIVQDVLAALPTWTGGNF